MQHALPKPPDKQALIPVKTALTAQTVFVLFARGMNPYIVCMAKQAGPFFITGTIDQVCFYKLDKAYYARSKSSLTRKRVLRDPAFKETRRHAELMGKASTIASLIYRGLPEEQQLHSLYRKLTGRAFRLLKENKTKKEIVTLLQPKRIKKISATIVCKNETGCERFLLADEILLQVFGGSVNKGEGVRCYDEAPP
jgi:hypothetical protein